MNPRRSLTRSQLVLRLAAGAATAAVLPALVLTGGAGSASAVGHRTSSAVPGPQAGGGGDVTAGYLSLQSAADQSRHRAAQVRAGRLSAAVLAPSAATSASTASTAQPAAAALTTAQVPSVGVTHPDSVLVLFDTLGEWGELGDLYRMSIANLVGHFGMQVVSKPVQRYTAGEVDSYAATFYMGSTYYGFGGTPAGVIPAAFFSDVVSTAQPVVWIYDNIWDFGQHAAAKDAFVRKYGWDPSNTSLGLTADQVTYKGQRLTRDPRNGEIIQPYITDPATAQTVATAVDTTTGATGPWAVRSGNFFYVGDIPFSYVKESDRYLVFADLLYDVLAPTTAEQHRALVRLEDVSAADDPADLKRAVDYLSKQHIPFGVNVIPVYEDPDGYYNNGQPVTLTLSQTSAFIRSLQYAVSKGGVLMEHGYTHQYSTAANPYDGVSGDDFEFFLSHIDSANDVILDRPLREDSASWAQDRITKGLAEFTQAKLPKPTLWTTPHYAASAVDYQTIGKNFTARWERSLYFRGSMDGRVDPSTWVGQFFPYVVRDVYGTTVLPENLGNYEPDWSNNNPPRLPQDLVASAQANLVVRDGFASFFYHPYYGLDPLKQIVTGIRKLGYTFVSPTTLTQQP